MKPNTQNFVTVLIYFYGAAEYSTHIIVITLCDAGINVSLQI